MIISVLGLGESVNEFINNGSTTIGVNDIWKHHKADYVVCVDRINAFTVNRLSTILKSKPKKFLTHLEEWKRIMPTFELIELSKGRGNLNDIDNTFAYSNNSVFVAVVLAYKLGATEINIYGADFNKMIAQSKVVLGFNVNAHCWGYWSNRVGKVLTVGGLLVQQYAPGMELLLPDCVSLFRNPQDLTTKIKNILEKSIYCPHKKHEEFTSNQRCYDLYFLITNYLKEGKLWNKLP